MIVARHDNDRFEVFGEVPETRQRFVRRIHLQNKVSQQPLLLIGLWDRDLVQIGPVRLRIETRSAEEQVV